MQKSVTYFYEHNYELHPTPTHKNVEAFQAKKLDNRNWFVAK